LSPGVPLPLPEHHEVGSLLCHIFSLPGYPVLPQAQSNGPIQPWTETSDTMSWNNLSSFKLFSSDVCHSNKAD
jgi:hypothetical protein